jgi:hypothetical protein
LVYATAPVSSRRWCRAVEAALGPLPVSVLPEEMRVVLCAPELEPVAHKPVNASSASSQHLDRPEIRTPFMLSSWPVG